MANLTLRERIETARLRLLDLLAAAGRKDQYVIGREIGEHLEKALEMYDRGQVTNRNSLKRAVEGMVKAMEAVPTIDPDERKEIRSMPDRMETKLDARE